MPEIKRHIVWLCAGCDECDPPYGSERVSGPCDGPSMNGAEVVLAEDYEKAEARVQVLERALKVAAHDLAKAANQFKGLLPEGQNWRKFEEKCERAEAVLASEDTPEEANNA